ncbi:hypothetical protein DPMN_148930 [Dreissena polymorpha]|uniref:Uncharacterized protein n=1 Tax=Dreissena polymorpha TaxID=45954 RepID=A0A9D4J202_DREPO|nr:hypothetical protein DPMN_148930 [Dreissena polymorpha]
MPRRSPGECQWRPGRAPIYRCTVAIPGLCRHSPGLNMGTTGDNRPLPKLCRGLYWPRWSYGAVPDVHGAVPFVPGAVPFVVLNGDSRFILEVLNIYYFPGGAPVVPGSSRSSPVEPRFIPVESRFIPVDPGLRTGAQQAS